MDCERLEFLRRWAKNTGQNETIVFDITSLSSYSALSEYAEPGYNRDKEKLPQINLGVLYAENSNLPLYYHIWPGSIRDVSTLRNIVKFLEYFELKDILFVMDRGFYSKANLSDMKQSEVRFIIPMPRTVNLFSALVNENIQKLSDLTNSFLFKDEILFHTEESVRINKVSLHANLYLDPQSRSDQRVRFLKKILNLEESCNKLNFQNKKEIVQYLSSQFNGASQFFRITVRKGKTKVSRKTETISERMADMGVTIILTDHNKIGRETILDLYRRKDYLEKTFDVLKNEFDGKRLRSSSKDTIEGRLFVKFLSLILYSAVGNIMRKQELFKRYSIREIMYELKKIRVVEMNNGKSYLTEISKRQREIFNKFGLEIPDI
jgi:transposase